MRKTAQLVLFVAAAAVCQQAASTQNPNPAPGVSKKSLPLAEIRLPPGFSIDVYASNVPSARQMALGSKGTVFVGSRGKQAGGAVHALVDRDGDQRADKVHRIASGLNDPNGVAFRDGALYVAEISRVLRYDQIESRLESPGKPAVVNDSLPTDTHHGQKFIAFGPDGLLYIPVGAPCNVCEREDPRYSTIMRMKPDGSGLEVFASGVRNTVGFDWHPQTRELWFTDNGRDMMGDDVPGDELNHAPKKGLHFGFPYCHEGAVPDPEFGKKRSCSEFEQPARKLDAHVAAIGMRFYTGGMFPAEYRNQIFIAEHGSWNRTIPQGYRVSIAKLDGNRVVAYERFAEGWLREINTPSGETKPGDVWGRPADVLVMPDGALLVSDDRAGVVFRISFKQ